ncbi:MAG TPA: hypothetical protein VHC63_17575 [Acidimicrobiales bacterium]|nr:hypothetical protein [Acidimicrobiales bacterium]
MAHALPSTTATAAATAVMVAVIGVALLLRRTSRRRRRSWLEVQLARLEACAGVPIDRAATLPGWLATLPSVQRDAFTPIVRALELEAWSATPLHDEDRRWIEQSLAKVRPPATTT